MEDAALVGELDGLGDALYITGGAARREWAVGDDFTQVLAFDVIHHQVMLVQVNADFVNGNDARVLEAAGGSRFDTKTLDRLRAGQRTEQEKLHRDDAVQADLPGSIDNAHSAATDFLHKFVVGEAAQGGELREWRTVMRGAWCVRIELGDRIRVAGRAGLDCRV